MRIVFCESTVLRGDNDWLFGQREKTLSAPMSTSLTGSIMPQAFWSRLPCCIAYYLISFGNDRSNQIYDMLRDLVAKAFLLFDSAIDFSSYESLHRLSQGPSLVQVLTFCFVDLLTQTHVHVNLSLLFGACGNSDSVTHFNHSPAVDFEIENSWIQAL